MRETWLMLRGREKLQLVRSMCILCFWFVICHPHVSGLERFSLDCRKGLVWFWFYYALWLATVFTLVLVLRQSSENRSIHRSAGPSTMLFQFVLYTNTLMFLSSSLNPLIYSWRMRHVRHAIMEILRNILPHPHQWQKKKTWAYCPNRGW